jgi:hypothetical protein
MADSEKLGIENIKNVLDFFFSFGNAFGRAMEDGKFQFLKEWPLFISTMVEIPPAIRSIPKFDDEIKDLDEQEYRELIEWAKGQFDIPQDEVEAQIEDTLGYAYSTLVFVQKTVDRWKKK